MLLALSILVAFIRLGWLFHVFLARAARRLAQTTKTKLDDILLSVLEKPLIAIIILSGLYLSAMSLPLEAAARLYLSKGLSIVLSILGIYVVLASVDALARWYGREVVGNKGGDLRSPKGRVPRALPVGECGDGDMRW
jgi:hypothetical protein